MAGFRGTQRVSVGAGMTVAFALLAACGGSAPAPVPAQPSDPRHETVRVGTTDLDEAVAARYGIARDPGTVLLLVGVRRGDDADETPIPAQVTATVTDLRGQRSPVEMRALHGNDPSGEAVLDYFAVVEASPPDTLRFDLDIAWPGGPGATLRVEHELRPD